MSVTNRGTGAGGANTNGNGLPYELYTDLSDSYVELQEPVETKQNSKPRAKSTSKCGSFMKAVSFLGYDRRIHTASKSAFHKGMELLGFLMVLPVALGITQPAHGCRQPDEAYVDTARKKIVIIEKKFQEHGGSVCEKIQTGDFKRRQYQKMYPQFEVHYVYCLSSWFKKNCAAEIDDLENYSNIPVFFGHDEKYKENIIHFIHNCGSECKQESC
jgi:hypothetical protein